MNDLRSSARAASSFIAATWLLVALSYLPWTFAIGGRAMHGASFTVDKWTLVTPFVIVLCAPVAAVLVWRWHALAGSTLFALVATNWVLWEWLGAGFIGVRDGSWPALFLFLLSLLSGCALVLQCLLRAQGKSERLT